MANLVGQKFGKLTVLKYAYNDSHGKKKWLCWCECGQKTIVSTSDLKGGHTKSCGCTNIKHGQKMGGKTSPTYISWYHMIDRCTNHDCPAYSNYGGRGILVCEEWLQFANFLKDMGERPPNYQIDRIDNTKGYYKENCRWTTPKQNSRNRRNNHTIEYNGTTKALIEWAEQIRVAADTIRSRINRGWSIEKTLTTSSPNNKQYTIVHCSWCGEPFAKLNKRITQTEKFGKHHACSRKCSSAMVNNDRRCEPTTINAIHTRRDKEKYPEKTHARYLVRQAVKSGKLIPLTECEFCGSENHVEAHHPDHSRPFFLLYLCKDCHSDADDSIDKWENLATDYSGCII